MGVVVMVLWWLERWSQRMDGWMDGGRDGRGVGGMAKRPAPCAPLPHPPLTKCPLPHPPHTHPCTPLPLSLSAVQVLSHLSKCQCGSVDQPEAD